MDMASTLTPPPENTQFDFGFRTPNYPLFIRCNRISNNASSHSNYSSNPTLHGIKTTSQIISPESSSGCSRTLCADCSPYFKSDHTAQQLPRDVLCHSASAGGICDDVCPGAPHNAFIFSLGHLTVCDLLTVERVCRSLHCTVRNDSLLWRNIHIDQRQSERITDDILVQLTNRAQGKLKSLSLMECTKITNDGLNRVLQRNLSLTKLSVPGCTRLSIDGVLSCLKAFHSAAIPGIKHLRIGGLYGMTERHFDDFKALLSINDEKPRSVPKPHFYSREKKYLSVEDERSIDIEVCPMCQNFRLVYDCPAGEHTAQICRACIICIPRCVDCGRCITDGQFEETFCLELLCFVCGEQSMDCEVKRNIKARSPVDFNHQEAFFPFQG